MVINVGVLRGGPSGEHEVSLKSGQAVLDHLPAVYRAVDVVISRYGLWLVDGVPRSPEKILPRFEVVFNALHGQYGEDGELQKRLRFSRFTGPDRLGAALAMNKYLAKNKLASHLTVRLPKHQLIKEREDRSAAIRLALSWIGLPAAVKPNQAGSSIGVTIVRQTEEIAEAIEAAFAHSSTVIMEEYIEGREASVAVVERLRGRPVYSLPPVEIIPPSDSFFDYSAKYGGRTEEVCPGRFGPVENRAMQEAAEAAHRELGLRHYSRTDFLIHPERGVYYLETNSLPGITPTSLLPLSLSAVGISFSDFLDHSLKLALADDRVGL